MRFLLILSSFILSLSLRIFILNEEDCSTSLHNGSISYPYCTIITGFIEGEKKIKETNDNELIFELMSSSYFITDRSLINKSTFFQNIYNISIQIRSYFPQNEIKIFLKTYSMRIFVGVILEITKIKIIGNDLIVSQDENIKSKKCFESNSLCCSNYTLIKNKEQNYDCKFEYDAIAIDYNEKNTSLKSPLFIFHNNSLYQKKLIMIDCTINGFYPLDKKNCYSSLIGLDNNNSTVILNNTQFSYFFFPLNLINFYLFKDMNSEYVKNNKIIMNNSMINNYNDLDLKLIINEFDREDIYLEIASFFLLNFNNYDISIFIDGLYLKNVCSFIRFQNYNFVLENSIISNNECKTNLFLFDQANVILKNIFYNGITSEKDLILFIDENNVEINKFIIWNSICNDFSFFNFMSFNRFVINYLNIFILLNEKIETFGTFINFHEKNKANVSNIFIYFNSKNQHNLLNFGLFNINEKNIIKMENLTLINFIYFNVSIFFLSFNYNIITLNEINLIDVIVDNFIKVDENLNTFYLKDVNFKNTKFNDNYTNMACLICDTEINFNSEIIIDNLTISNFFIASLIHQFAYTKLNITNSLIENSFLQKFIQMDDLNLIHIINLQVINFKSFDLPGKLFSFISLTSTNNIFLQHIIFDNKESIPKKFTPNKTIIILENRNKITIFNISCYGFSKTKFLMASEGNTIEVNNSFFENLNHSIEAGVFSIYSSNVLFLNNNNFVNIFVKINGGIIFAYNFNEINIENSIFKFISAKYKGAIIYANEYNKINILDSSFSCLDVGSGGLVYSMFFNVINVNNSFFYNVSSTKSGSILFLNEGNQLLISYTKFTLISSLQDSGMLFLSLGNIVNFNHIIVSVAISSLCGGLVFAMNDNSLIFNNSNIINSNSMLNGGAFYLSSWNNLSLSNSAFFQVVSFLFTNSIYLDRYNLLNLKKVIFIDSNGLKVSYNSEIIALKLKIKYNYLSNNSGIIKYISDEQDNLIPSAFCICFYSNVSFVDTEIEGTEIGFTIGELCQILNTKLQITTKKYENLNYLYHLKGGRFIGNDINIFSPLNFIFILNDVKIRLKKINFMSSGTVFMTGRKSNIEIINSYFYCLKNPKKIEEIENGFITVEYSFLSIKTSTFYGGYAHHGGVVSATNTNVIFKKSMCLFNYATNSGGCISINQTIISDYLYFYRISKSIFLGNEGINGGAIRLLGNHIKSRNCFLNKNIFIFNKANKGGALLKDTTSNVKAFHLKFLYNTAKKYMDFLGKGGAFYIECSQNKCTIDELNFKNAYFAKNKADNGGALFFEMDPSAIFPNVTLKFLNISLFDNKASHYGNDIATPPNSIAIMTQGSENLFFTKKFRNLISGKTYPCLYYIVGLDNYNNMILFFDHLSSLEINEKNKKENKLILEKESHGYICGSGILITNPKPNIELTFDLEFKDKSFYSENKNQKKLSIELEYRQCEIGERQTDDFRCEICPTGFYSFNRNSTEKCLLCNREDPFYCLGSSFIGPKPGFWRIDYYSNNFIRCPNPSSCLGYYVSDPIYYEKEKSTGICQVGYKGILCAECVEGYGITNGYYCTSCDSFSYYASLIFFLVIRLFVIIYSLHTAVAMCSSSAAGLMKTQDIVSSTVMKILLNHFQVLNIIFSFPFEWKKEIHDVASVGVIASPSITDAYSFQCILQKFGINLSTQYLKIVNIWFSILFLMGLCYAYYKFYLTKKIKFYLKFIKKTENDILESTYFIILFICYLDIVSVCLETFSCRDIGYPGNEEYRLIKDYSIKCWDDSHEGWIFGLVFPFLVLFGIGFPLTIFYVLIYLYKKRKLKQKDSILRYGYFYLSYETEYFYWDFVILIRKITLTSINIFLLAVYTKLTNYIVTMMLLVLIIFLYLQVECQPYLKKELKSVNNLEKYSLVSLSATMFLAIFSMETYFAGTGRIYLFTIALILHIFFFISWGQIYYKSDLKKKLKTIIHIFSKVIYYFFSGIKRFCFDSIPRNSIRYVRRIGLLKMGVDKNAYTNERLIYLDFEKYNNDLIEIENEEKIIKTIYQSDFFLQLNFTYFEKSKITLSPSNNNRRLLSRTVVKPDRISFSPYNSDSSLRPSKFFTLMDSSPFGGRSSQSSKSKGKSNRHIFEIENLTVENKVLKDSLDKAMKEIHDLKYLIVVNQEYSILDQDKRDDLENDIIQNDFFLKEITINYEKFLESFENSFRTVENLRAIIQNSGILFENEHIKIQFNSFVSKIKTKKPLLSLSLHVYNKSDKILHNIKIITRNQDAIISQFPSINNLDLTEKKYINQEIVLNLKISLISPIKLEFDYTLENFLMSSTIILPLSLFNIVQLIDENKEKFCLLWNNNDLMKIKGKKKNLKDKKKLLNLLFKYKIFKNSLIILSGTNKTSLMLRSTENEVPFFENKLVCGIVLKSIYDDKIFVIKIKIKENYYLLETKIEKNNLDNFRFLELLFETIYLGLKEEFEN